MVSTLRDSPRTCASAQLTSGTTINPASTVASTITIPPRNVVGDSLLMDFLPLCRRDMDLLAPGFGIEDHAVAGLRHVPVKEFLAAKPLDAPARLFRGVFLDALEVARVRGLEKIIIGGQRQVDPVGVLHAMLRGENRDLTRAAQPHQLVEPRVDPRGILKKRGLIHDHARSLELPAHVGKLKEFPPHVIMRAVDEWPF